MCCPRAGAGVRIFPGVAVSLNGAVWSREHPTQIQDPQSLQRPRHRGTCARDYAVKCCKACSFARAAPESRASAAI